MHSNHHSFSWEQEDLKDLGEREDLGDLRWLEELRDLEDLEHLMSVRLVQPEHEDGVSV